MIKFCRTIILPKNPIKGGNPLIDSILIHILIFIQIEKSLNTIWLIKLIFILKAIKVNGIIVTE